MNRKIADKLRDNRGVYVAFVLMNLLYAFSYFQRVAVPGTIFNQLQSDLALSSSAVALLGGIYLYVYGGIQAFSGALVDRFGPRRVILAGGVFLSIGSIAFPLCHTHAGLLASRFIVGLGDSVMYLSLIKVVDSQFSSKNFSALLSMVCFAGYVGGLAGTMPLNAAATAFGWRPSMLAVGIACTIAVALAYVFSRRMTGQSKSQTTAPVIPAIRQILLNRICFPVTYVNVISFGIYFIFQAVIGKKFLEDCGGLSSSLAASGVFLLTLVAMTGGVLTGFASRALGNRRKPVLVLVSAATVLAPCAGLLVVSAGNAWILPCYVLFGISASGAPVFGSSVKELNRPDFAGSSVGVTNSITYLGIAVFSTLSGLTLDRFAAHAVRTATAVHYPHQAYQTILLGCLALGISAFIASLFIRETSGRNIWEAVPENS